MMVWKTLFKIIPSTQFPIFPLAHFEPLVVCLDEQRGYGGRSGKGHEHVPGVGVVVELTDAGRQVLWILRVHAVGAPEIPRFPLHGIGGVD